MQVYNAIIFSNNAIIFHDYYFSCHKLLRIAEWSGLFTLLYIYLNNKIFFYMLYNIAIFWMKLPSLPHAPPKPANRQMTILLYCITYSNIVRV